MNVVIVADKHSFNAWIRAQPSELREEFRHAYQPEHLQGLSRALVILLNDWHKLPAQAEIREILDRLRASDREVAIIRSIDGGQFTKVCDNL